MKSFQKKLALVLAAFLCSTLAFSSNAVMAEEGNENEELMKAATSISISPVSKILQLEANSVYEDVFKVTNNGSATMDFEVYASPYSYSVDTEEGGDGEYKLGFSKENAYTQITRWITFRDLSGNYVENPHFTAQPGESVEITYKISTPASIPAGGQYAVLFAHTLSNNTTSSGIKTEASPGLVVYGRSSGETITGSEISFPEESIKQSYTDPSSGETHTWINATAKVKNTGNVDFMAQGKLKVEGLFGQVYYETPSTQGRVSVIPDVELAVTDIWEGTPYFGIFKVSWTVSATGETETISKMVFLLPAPIVIGIILLLTILIIWIILMVRKRKERRSRFTV